MDSLLVSYKRRNDQTFQSLFKILNMPTLKLTCHLPIFVNRQFTCMKFQYCWLLFCKESLKPISHFLHMDAIKSSLKPYSKVFAKVPGFPYWPGTIIPPDKYPHFIGNASDKQVAVLFYGSMDFSLVRLDLLKDFDKSCLEFSKTKRKDLLKAIAHAQAVHPRELISLISPEMYKPPKITAKIVEQKIEEVESPRKGSMTSRKSKRRKLSPNYKEFDTIVKMKRYLAHRIYGEHKLKVDVDKIDLIISWLSSLKDINFKIIEESRIGHILGYIALKPPNNKLGQELKMADIPQKCTILIGRWKKLIKSN